MNRADRPTQPRRDREQQGVGSRLDAAAQQAGGDVNWLSDVTLSDRWLMKLSPYLDKEIVQQLRTSAPEAIVANTPRKAGPSQPSSRRSNRQTAKGPSSDRTRRSKTDQEKKKDDFERAKAPGNATREGGLDGVLQEAVVESFIDALDATGTDWIHALHRPDKRNGKSWWQQVNLAASRKMKAWNKSLNNSSRSFSRKLANVARPDSIASQNISIDQRVHLSKPWGIVFVLVAGGGVALYSWYRYGGRQAAPRTAPAAAFDSVQRITDCDSLLRTCHQLAYEEFGWRSCFWHHRRLFSALSDKFPDSEEPIGQLADIYEQGRYSGAELSVAQIELAQRLVRRIQQRSP